jgi:ribosomal protein S24E
MSKDYTSTSTTIHREISKMKTFDFEKVNMLKKMVDYITNEYGKASNGLEKEIYDEFEIKEKFLDVDIDCGRKF